jgi:SAM-dependent methyltransferase
MSFSYFISESEFEASFEPQMHITIRGEKVRLDAPYIPTPQGAVERMVELAEIKPGEVVYDLGCGDGRILVEAAKKHGVKAIGVDLDPKRVEEAIVNAKEAGVDHLVTVREGNIFDEDFKDADVVFLYLFSSLNTRLLPQLKQMKPGARVIAFEFPIAGVKPIYIDRSLDSKGDGSRTLFKWVLPFEPSEGLSWENNHLSDNINYYTSRFPIKFIATNNSDQENKIVQLVPDCRSCVNLSPSSDTIKPGESVEVSAEILLKPTKSRQVGKIAVFYESGVKDVLSYQIAYPIPYDLSPESLTWFDERDPKVVRLKFNENLEIKYLSHRVESKDFQVTVVKADEKGVDFEVLPLTNGRVRSSLFIELENHIHWNSNIVEPISYEELFVTLTLEEVAN